jgi:hypothetical protein
LEETVKHRKRGQVSAVNGFNGLLEVIGAVRVGQQIPVIQHIHPNLSVWQDFGGERIFQHLPWGDGGEHPSIGFHVIFHRLPSEFEAIPEASDASFLLQGIQHPRAVLQGGPQTGKRTIEILETLLPPSVLSLAHLSSG